MELRQQAQLPPTRAGEVVKLKIASARRAEATSGEAVLAIERRGEQLGRWMQMTLALAQESGKVEPAVHQQNAASSSVRLAIELIADTSRTLAGAAQQVASTAAAEATVATQLASRAWDQERNR
jgi:hypothetical protein